MEPAVKQEIYNISRLGLSTVQAGSESRDLHWRGTNRRKRDKDKKKYAKQFPSSNCKMLQESQI